MDRRIQLFELMIVGAEAVVGKLVAQDATDHGEGADGLEVVGEESETDGPAGVEVDAQELGMEPGM